MTLVNQVVLLKEWMGDPNKPISASLREEKLDSGPLDVFDESRLYDDCAQMSLQDYQDHFIAWSKEESVIGSDGADSDSADLGGNSSASIYSDGLHDLGWQPDLDARTGSDVDTLTFDGSRCAGLQNGLRYLLRFALPPSQEHELSVEQQKLLAAITAFIRNFHATLHPKPKKSTIYVLRKFKESFSDYFDVLTDLEIYAFTCKTPGAWARLLRKDLIRFCGNALCLY